MVSNVPVVHHLCHLFDKTFLSPRSRPAPANGQRGTTFGRPDEYYQTFVSIVGDTHLVVGGWWLVIQPSMSVGDFCGWCVFFPLEILHLDGSVNSSL